MSNTVTHTGARSAAFTTRPAAAMAPDAADLYTRAGGRKYLNASERERLLAVLGEMPRDQALFIRTLSWTGARVSEVLALRREAFQPDRGIVALCTLKRRRHSMREVPVPPELITDLDAAFGIGPASPGKVRPEERLWPWHRATGWRVVKHAMTLAGLTGTAASPRGLRHAFGVGTLQSGVPLNLVQRWLGHSRITTTAIYAAIVGPEELAFARRFWTGGPSQVR